MGNSEKAAGANRIQRFVSILFLIFSGIYLFLSLSLPLGKAAKPGPGMVPRGIGIVLTFFCLVHVIEVFFLKNKKNPSEKKAEEALKGKDVFRVAGVVSLLILYMIFFPILGYAFSTIILVGAVLRLLEMHGWMRIVLISIVTSGCSYFIFDRILDVPLPKGMMPF
jgi:putative tricarboxylic transport membrane protein